MVFAVPTYHILAYGFCVWLSAAPKAIYYINDTVLVRILLLVFAVRCMVLSKRKICCFYRYKYLIYFFYLIDALHRTQGRFINIINIMATSIMAGRKPGISWRKFVIIRRFLTESNGSKYLLWIFRWKEASGQIKYSASAKNLLCQYSCLCSIL